MKNKLLLAIIAIISLSPILILSSDTLFHYETFALYPKFGLNYNIHSANFKNFQGSVDCNQFSGSSLLSYSGGLSFERAFNPVYQISLGLNYINRSATFNSQLSDFARDLNTGDVVSVNSENKLDINLVYFEIQPDIRKVLVENLINGPLRAFGGLRLGFAITKSFIQDETIQSPSGAVFVNNGGIKTKQRLIAQGDIVTITQPSIGITLGLDNLLKVGEDIYFTQQLSFDYNFTKTVSDAEWNSMGVRFELGLRYGFLDKPQPIIKIDTPKPIEVIIAKKIELKPEITISNVTYSDLKIYSGDELLSTLPLVNAVFFDRNSSAVPNNYSIQKTDQNYFNGDPIEKHKYVIPRVVEIMKANPNSKIEIESSTSGGNNEQAGIELANERAKEIKAAFKNLGINENQITTSSRIIPKYVSNQEFPEGVVENQRVDLNLKNAQLQEFVNLNKYTEVRGKVLLEVDFKDLNGKSIVIKNSLNDKVIIVDKPGIYEIPIKERWDNISDLNLQINAISDDISDKKSVNVNLATIPQENESLDLSKFEAILRFNYNSSELTDDNKLLLKQLTEKLPTNSTIQVLGSTDFLGTDERNSKLAKERATVTETYLKSLVGNKFNIETGTTDKKFDDSSPEGRFLNRSIRVKVK